MMRFIDLTGQIYDVGLDKENPSPCIAYFDTVKSQFLEVDGAQVFTSLENFKSWVRGDIPEWSSIDWPRLERITPEEFLT